MTFSTKPYAFQREGVDYIHAHGGRVLVADDPGLGKSLMALLTAHEKPDARPVIIVCQAFLKWHWERQCKVHVGIMAEVLNGTRPGRDGGLPRQRDFLIVNYDIIYAWLDWLKSLNPQFVILDESQACSDPRSRRSRTCKRLCEGVPYVLPLSGTPFLNRPAQLWQTLNILWPTEFPSAYRFYHEHCGMRRTHWGWSFDGATRIPLLRSKLLKLGFLRRRKEQVLEQLPPKQRTIIPLEIKDRKEYDKAADDFMAWLVANYSPGRAKRASRAKRLVQFSVLKKLIGCLKAPAVYEWIDSFLSASNEKLIVFTYHRKDDCIAKKLKERYKNICVVVDGSVTGKNRQLAIDQFLNLKGTRLFIGNIKAVGSGWSAKGVSATAFVEFSTTPGDYIQGGGRTRGIQRGREGEPSREFWLVAKSTIEERLVKILQKRQRVISEVLDGGKGDKLDVFDALCKSLLKNKEPS